MTTPMGGTNTYQIAVQETQNQQLLLQIAEREAESAQLVAALAANSQGPMAAGVRQLAAQEMQNVVMLRQLAAREAVNASQLGLASSGDGAGAVPATNAAALTGIATGLATGPTAGTAFPPPRNMDGGS